MTDPIVDFHCHPLLPEIVDALDKAEFGGMSLPTWSVDKQLAMMDMHGIKLSMLSVNSVAEGMVGVQGRTTARKINEAIAKLVGLHSTRFGAFATVPMDDMDAAIEETAYALDVLKLDGIGIVTHFRGKYLGDAEYDPWFTELNSRSVTLFVHPAAPPQFDPTRERANVSVVEFMFESTRMVTSLVLSGAKSRFSKIAVISTHGGGTVPYLAQRICMAESMPWAFRDGPKMTFDEIRASLGSFYFDLTAATSSASLDALRALVSADHLVLGFDFPFMPEQSITPSIASLVAYTGFNEKERQRIVNQNATCLVPRLNEIIVSAGEK